MLKRLLDLPVWMYVAAGVLAIVLAVGGFRAYTGSLKREAFNAGKAETQRKWDAAVERGKAEIARLEAAAGKITVVKEVEVVERIKTVYQKGEDRVRTVEVFVPQPSPERPTMLDGGFRVYHDAAATNTIPNPAEIPNAAAVSPTDVARTINANYTQCHRLAEQVRGWQEWATEQCKLNDKGCPDG